MIVIENEGKIIYYLLDGNTKFEGEIDMRATEKQKEIIGVIVNNLDWAATCNDFRSPSLYNELGVDLTSEDVGLSMDEAEAIADKVDELLNLIRKIK